MPGKPAIQFPLQNENHVLLQTISQTITMLFDIDHINPNIRLGGLHFTKGALFRA